MFIAVFLTSFQLHCVLQGKLLGEEWKKISDDDKAEFEEKAEEDKKRYKKEMQDYTPPSDDDSDDGGGKKKAKRAKKDPNAPKRPMNAYMLYANSVRSQIREENPDMAMADVVSVMD